jgi:hypothetical protein
MAQVPPDDDFTIDTSTGTSSSDSSNYEVKVSGQDTVHYAPSNVEDSSSGGDDSSSDSDDSSSSSDD